jgi:hypothetical protein
MRKLEEVAKEREKTLIVGHESVPHSYCSDSLCAVLTISRENYCRKSGVKRLRHSHTLFRICIKIEVLILTA